MKLLANNIRLQYNEEHQPEIILTTKNGQVLNGLYELKEIIGKGKLLETEIKQHRKKRSLDANSYAWVLITRIANKLRNSKEEVYIKMLERYGQREPKLVSVVSEAVDMIYRATNNHCTVIGTSVLNDKEFTHLAILVGSSQYDTKQMSILIDGIVSDAKELGIETMTPAELELLKQDWGKKGE